MANMIALRPLERGVSGLVRTRGQSALFSAGGLRGGQACVLLENGEVLVEPLAFLLHRAAGQHPVAGQCPDGRSRGQQRRTDCPGGSDG